MERDVADSGRTNRLELKTEERDIKGLSENDNSGTERNGGTLERIAKRDQD